MKTKKKPKKRMNQREINVSFFYLISNLNEQIELMHQQIQILNKQINGNRKSK